MKYFYILTFLTLFFNPILSQENECIFFEFEIIDIFDENYLNLQVENFEPEYFQEDQMYFSWFVLHGNIISTSEESSISIEPQSNVVYPLIYIDYLDFVTGELMTCSIMDTISWNGYYWTDGFFEVVDTTDFEDPIVCLEQNQSVSSIDEIDSRQIKSTYYDLSGRRYNSYESIPLGQSYIWNRKVYVKTSYTHNP
jgi:hypothetical protein